MVTTSPTSATKPTPPTAPSADKPSTMAGGDFETFLRMLTTQIKNQDPMNPMEGSDFAVQLATFSGVEQQVRTNDLLQSLGRQMGVSGLAQLSGWIGKEAQTTAPVYFGHTPLTLTVEPDPRADQVILVTLRDGKEISREDIGTGAGQVEWFGRDEQGGKLDNGLYQFRTESLRNGESLGTQPVASYAVVNEAKMTDEGLKLIFPGGATALADEVKALRERQG